MADLNAIRQGVVQGQAIRVKEMTQAAEWIVAIAQVWAETP